MTRGLVVGWFVWLALGSSIAEPSLEGCGDVTAIVKALSVARGTKWRTVSPETILTSWPHALTTIERTTTDVNGYSPYKRLAEAEHYVELLGYRGRVINNRCECCETLVFEAGSGQPTEPQLKAIIIEHTEKNWAAALTVARQLGIAALGDEGSKLLKLGSVRSPIGPIQMTIVNPPDGKHPDVVDLSVSKADDGAWTVYVHYTRDEVDEAAKMPELGRRQ
jgi:hypothetical protein